MPGTPYLKNVGQEAPEGVYWLFIKGGDLQAMFRLDTGDHPDSIPRRTLDAWLAEQDSTNAKTNKPQDNFPDRI
jgi:hypothetical protein